MTIDFKNLPKDTTIRSLPENRESSIRFIDIYTVNIPEHNWAELVTTENNGWLDQLVFIREVQQWLAENIRNDHVWHRVPYPMIRSEEGWKNAKTGFVRFKNEKDAILFKLRWLG